MHLLWMPNVKTLIFSVCFTCMCFSLYVCSLAFSWTVAFSYASNMFSSLGRLCFCQRLWFVCCHRLRMRVFTRLQHLIQSIVWFGADGCRLPEECDSWSKLKLRMVARKDRKGSKKRRCDYHQTISWVEEASIPILSARSVTDTKCFAG